jgi:rhodanese-related sulfurtransferase
VIHQSSDVYGISRDLPLNYIERSSADARLIDNLSREKHLVIFGSSKQGKTSLRKHTLADDESIVIHCSNKWQISDIHAAILKKAGFELTQSTSKTTTGKFKIFAK